ncbi:MAG: tol-pal system protein YbgF, partial [Pseudomonadota bacterium]
QVNQMQADDAEIAKLISRLESRLAAQDKKISDLEGQLAGVQSTVRNYSSIAPVQSSDASGDATDTAAGTTTVTRRTVTTQPTTDGTTRTVTVTGQPTRITRTTEPASTSGPTRITRTVNADEAGTLPQGTLGELPASNLPGEAGPLFAEAKSRLLRFDYEGAEMAFETFLSQFGDDPQAGEAQYWLAEALYQQEAYAESGQAYTKMIRTYPDDPRAPEALAKLARAMRLVGDTDRACNALDLLPQQYPNASGLTQNLARGERVRSGCDS